MDLSGHSIYTVFAIFLSVGFVNYLYRTSFFWFFDPDKFPESFKRMLRFLPAAILSALVFPTIVFVEGDFNVVSNEKWYVAIFAMVISYYTKSIFWTLILGMTVFTIIQFYLKG